MKILVCPKVAKEQDERNQFVISVWQLRSCQEDLVYAMDFSTEQQKTSGILMNYQIHNPKYLFGLDLLRNGRYSDDPRSFSSSISHV